LGKQGSVWIDAATNRLEADLQILRLKQRSETTFKARVNLVEHGEKSNKIFVNLNKKYNKQKFIDNINIDSVSYCGQEEVSKEKAELYQKLYKLKEVCPDEIDFYDNCPKLSQAALDEMEAKFQDSDLPATLNSYTNSSPQPDVIPNSNDKIIWCIAEPFILNSCKHSCNTGVLPA
jgi:hypothetical protein